jgi:hypothetical protein
MNRRTAVATAGAVTLTLLAGSTALAANLGILERRGSDTVGDLSPVSDTFTTSDDSSTVPSVVETIVVDDSTPTSDVTTPTSDVTTPDSTPGATTDVTFDDHGGDDDATDDDATDDHGDDDEVDDRDDDTVDDTVDDHPSDDDAVDDHGDDD